MGRRSTTYDVFDLPSKRLRRRAFSGSLNCGIRERFFLPETYSVVPPHSRFRIARTPKRRRRSWRSSKNSSETQVADTADRAVSTVPSASRYPWMNAADTGRGEECRTSGKRIDHAFLRSG